MPASPCRSTRGEHARATASSAPGTTGVEGSATRQQPTERAHRERPRRRGARIVRIRTDLDRAEALRELLAGNERKEQVPEVRNVERADHPDANYHGACNEVCMIAAMSPSSTVEVLLSTHNGERYIATQLASILSQLHTDIRVTVRDDESTDGTVALVQAMAAEDPRVRVVAGSRLGWAGSFMALLVASGKARWLAFSDQDDVWLPDKLTRAVTALAPLDEDRPALYGSAMLHVSDEIRWLSVTHPPRRMSFENALVQNVVAGCTMVFNRAARALCLERVPPPAVHDWWLYLVTAAFGTVIFDDSVTVLHRVHADNATPVPLWGHWLRRVATHLKLPPDRRP